MRVFTQRNFKQGIQAFLLWPADFFWSSFRFATMVIKQCSHLKLSYTLNYSVSLHFLTDTITPVSPLWGGATPFMEKAKIHPRWYRHQRLIGGQLYDAIEQTNCSSYSPRMLLPELCRTNNNHSSKSSRDRLRNRPHPGREHIVWNVDGLPWAATCWSAELEACCQPERNKIIKEEKGKTQKSGTKTRKTIPQWRGRASSAERHDAKCCTNVARRYCSTTG